MKTSFQVCALVLICGFVSPAASAALRYVNVNSATPTAPYTTWSTAATVIQDAIDVAEPGDEIVVTDGVYQLGGREVSRPASGTFLHRVAVTQPVIVRSLNGAELTIIDAAKEMRCVYLSDGAALVGFTLSNGVTGSKYNNFQSGGGGAWCEAASSISNCIFSGNMASYEGGGVYGGNLDKCIFKGNSAWNGGGSAYANLNDCLVSGNTADFVGGGTYFGLGNNCTLVGNSARSLGGGCYSTYLNGSVVTSNRAAAGGGAFGGTMNNCTITANSASDQAGGVWGVASSGGGWCDESVCGAYGGAFNNCIVYYNDAPVEPNFSSEAILNYSCTAPMPANGTANITTEPQLASSSHISAVSPCHGAGSSTYVSGVDIDGESWANPPSIGCDEKLPGQETGPIRAAIEATFTNVATGFEVHFAARISGNVNASHWEFGDGTIVSNRPYTSHAWTVPADYDVVLRVFNQSFPMGVTATVTVHVAAQAVRHVGGEEASNPVPPYISWATAAREIQEAIDVALPGDEVLVANGVYRTGGRTVHGLLTNRVAITKPITVRSVNGPAVTLVEGYRMPLTNFGPSAVRCVYLTNGAALIGFTLTNGGILNYDATIFEADVVGGGVWCESVGATLSHCILTDNAAIRDGGGVYRGTLLNCTLARNVADNGGGAYMASLTNCVVSTNSAFYGGGAIGGTLTGCTLTGNSGGDGGGAVQSTLNNCLLVGNSAQSGGGAANSLLNNCVLTGNRATGGYSGGGGGTYGGTLNNCILYYNTALSPNYSDFTVLNYSCTTPLPRNGVGNITNGPLFVELAAGNFRLQSNSPCINAGRNAYPPAGTDLDGNPRIVGGSVDIGAYEFQSPQSTISYAWLEQFGLPTDGSADSADTDGDGCNNWQEWRAGTDPTSSLSVLRLLSPMLSSDGLVVRWQSVTDRTYRLERTTNLTQGSFEAIASNLVGQAGATAYMDTNAETNRPLFYRLRVEE